MPERRQPKEVRRLIEVGPVERVEDLEPELEGALFQRHAPREREVHVLKARTLERVAPDVAERPKGRERKRLRVEPLVRRR